MNCVDHVTVTKNTDSLTHCYTIDSGVLEKIGGGFFTRVFTVLEENRGNIYSLE